MTDTQFSVLWDEYQKNICKGFGGLQQRGEFVDMTIAADGYHVKVHQMIMSLISPYIKELITSAQCPHPIIFLNKVSYQTLQSILEYAYTGEVLIRGEKIAEFIEACTSLRIKGLENMKKNAEMSVNNRYNNMSTSFEIERIENNNDEIQNETHGDHNELVKEQLECIGFSDEDDVENTDSVVSKIAVVESERKVPVFQYSVSCQGNLQLLLNRCLYSLRHIRKNNERFWRCISQQTKSCPASVITKEDRILKRESAHNHSFHDKQIMKRVQNENVFSALIEVEKAAAAKKLLLNKDKFNTHPPDATTK